MTSAVLQKVRSGILAAGLCASLALGSLGFAMSAEARVPTADPRVDSLAATCGALQDQFDALVAEYTALYNSNPNSSRLDEIISSIRQIGQSWMGACFGSFGSIAKTGMGGATMKYQPELQAAIDQSGGGVPTIKKADTGHSLSPR